MALHYVEIAPGMKLLPGYDDLQLARVNVKGADIYLAELNYLRVTGEVLINAEASRAKAQDHLERVAYAIEQNGGGRI